MFICTFRNMQSLFGFWNKGMYLYLIKIATVPEDNRNMISCGFILVADFTDLINLTSMKSAFSLGAFSYIQSCTNY